MTKYGYIYKIVCTVNGKIYIGQTTQTLQERLKQHFYNSVNDHRTITKLGGAILKYGRSNFQIFPICYANSKDELNSREIFCIRIFDSINKGYNILRGGHNVKEWSDERKKKMSLDRKGKPKPKGFGEKISKALKGRKQSESHRMNNIQAQINCQAHHDYRHTEETKKKMSEAMKGIPKSKEHCRKIAERNRQRIVTEKTKKKMSEKRKGRKPNQKSVLCITNNTQYESVTIASEKLGLSINSLHNHLKGRLKNVKGLIFKYN